MNALPVLTIILNWRQPELTIECVNTLQASTYQPLDIMVIDNGSGDDSVEILRQNLPNVTVISFPENRGFAKGCNWGLRWAQENAYSWAFLLNNDAFVTPTTLDALMAAIDTDVGLLSPKIFYENQPEILWFAGGTQHPTLLEMRETGQGELDKTSWKQTRNVDYLVGTGLLVNLTAVSKVGLLDENYFMYYEDLDWSIRLRQAGYKLRLVANAHLYHRVSFSTGGASSPAQLYYQGRSSVIFFYQHAREGNPWLILLFRLGSAFKRIGILLWRGESKAIRHYLRGLWDGWQEIKKGKGTIPLPFDKL